MSTPNDGGPAFPVEHNTIHNGKQITFPSNGMTLRDYFAGQALAGMLADSERSGTLEEYTRYAYDFADAMLKAREVQP